MQLAQSPFVARARARTLPAADLTGRIRIAAADRSPLTDAEPVRIAADGGRFLTVADLQRRMAAESDR